MPDQKSPEKENAGSVLFPDVIGTVAWDKGVNKDVLPLSLEKIMRIGKAVGGYIAMIQIANANKKSLAHSLGMILGSMQPKDVVTAASVVLDMPEQEVNKRPIAAIQALRIVVEHSDFQEVFLELIRIGTAIGMSNADNQAASTSSSKASTSSAQSTDTPTNTSSAKASGG